VVGVAVAIKNGQFEWNKVGQFYRTMVVPNVIGYLALYVMFGVVPGLEGLVGEGLHTVAFGLIVVNLLGSVVFHLRALGLKRE
jgi:ABC-type spermidine/putrescine transport system permease subunit II